MRGIIAVAACSLTLVGCAIYRKTETSRSASEEMLLSSAADHAAEAIGRSMPRDSKLYFDTSEFTATDDKYAIGAIRDALLRHGNRLVDKRSDAAVVVEIRSGALATDDRETLVGIPSISIPLPLTATAIETPKIALYDKFSQFGVAKFAATATDATSGALVASSTPQYGFAHRTKYILLFIFGWTREDGLPDPSKDPHGS
jgi:hypothetical protein